MYLYTRVTLLTRFSTFRHQKKVLVPRKLCKNRNIITVSYRRGQGNKRVVHLMLLNDNTTFLFSLVCTRILTRGRWFLNNCNFQINFHEFFFNILRKLSFFISILLYYTHTLSKYKLFLLRETLKKETVKSGTNCRPTFCT